MSSYLAAEVGLNRIPTLFMDRQTQQDICAELEEEIQSIPLIPVTLSLSGMQVSLFLSLKMFSNLHLFST